MTTAPISILGIDHVVLRCADLEGTLAFYQDVLGCPLERALPDLGLFQVRAGATLIDLVRVGSRLGGDGAPDPATANMHHFCLRIAPTRWPDLIAFLRSVGVAVESPARRYGAEGYGLSVYLRDPEGNSVELKAPPGAASSVT